MDSRWQHFLLVYYLFVAERKPADCSHFSAEDPKHECTHQELFATQNDPCTLLLGVRLHLGTGDTTQMPQIFIDFHCSGAAASLWFLPAGLDCGKRAPCTFPGYWSSCNLKHRILFFFYPKQFPVNAQMETTLTVCGRRSFLGKGQVTAFLKCHKSSNRRVSFLKPQVPILGAPIWTDGWVLLECKPGISWRSWCRRYWWRSYFCKNDLILHPRDWKLTFAEGACHSSAVTGRRELRNSSGHPAKSQGYEEGPENRSFSLIWNQHPE